VLHISGYGALREAGIAMADPVSSTTLLLEKDGRKALLLCLGAQAPKCNAAHLFMALLIPKLLLVPRLLELLKRRLRCLCRNACSSPKPRPWNNRCDQARQPDQFQDRPVCKVAYVMPPCHSDLCGSRIGSSLAQPINEGIGLPERPLWVASGHLVHVGYLLGASTVIAPTPPK
jgi:hypothetical protein